MIRPPFVFERRSKHPAHNATNALLNLGYVLLGNEIASRLEAAGFDPRIGYFHGLRYGRSSWLASTMARRRWRGTRRGAIADGDLTRLTPAPAALVRALVAELVARQVAEPCASSTTPSSPRSPASARRWTTFARRGPRSRCPACFTTLSWSSPTTCSNTR